MVEEGSYRILASVRDSESIKNKSKRNCNTSGTGTCVELVGTLGLREKSNFWAIQESSVAVTR
jgi:hypothetical protein